MTAKRKDKAALKRLWLSGKYLTLEAMAKALNAQGDKISLTTLKRLSAKNAWILDATKLAPAIERKATAKFVEKESTRLARIRTSFVDLQELLLEKTMVALKAKGNKLDAHQALRAVQGLVQVNARIFPAQPDEDDIPAPRQPVNVAVQVNNLQSAPDQGDEEVNALEDEELEAAIRAGQAILEAERAGAKPKKRHPKKSREGGK